MADIAAFQSTTIANLAKAWGTTTANLSKIMGLTVSTGLTGNVSAGTPAVFESASTDYISVCMMDSTHAIVCYRDNSDSKVYACCLSLSGTAITAGTAVEVAASDSYYATVCQMDSTHAICCYQRSGSFEAKCLSLSGTTVSAGSACSIDGTATSGVKCQVCKMDSTHAIVCYSDNGNSGYGTACCLSLSGTTITAGTPAVFASATTSHISVCAMDSTHAVVCYRGTSNYGTSCCLSLSGTTITAGDPAVFESASSYYTATAKLDSTHAIVCYRDEGNSNYGTACCLSLSGTTITAGTPAVFESAAAEYLSICAVDSSHAVVSYVDGGNSNYGTACCLTLSGTTITAGTPAVFESASIAGGTTSICAMDGTHAIVCYQDGGNSCYGTACCLTIS